MTLEEYKENRMRDPEFRKEYEKIQPEMNIVRAIIDARVSNNLSQNDLAKLTGINQSEISKLENGSRNPSIKLYASPDGSLQLMRTTCIVVVRLSHSSH